MLLRRVIEHVKTQNWTAVGLDFVIVVVGVLLAFQITSWNEDRLAAKDERLALERLQAESEEIVLYFQEVVERRREMNEERLVAIAALNSGSLEGVDQDTVERGLITLGRYSAISPKRSTYDELTSSGQLGKISDTAVRESIAAYYAEYNFIQSQLDFFRLGSQLDYRQEGTALGYVYNPTDDGVIERFMDFESLARNEAYIHVATQSLRNQLVFQRYRRALLEEAEAMCRELSRAVGKDCAPLAVDAG